jgi:hypothetical protein
MAKTPKGTIRELQTEFGRDFSRFNSEFVNNLKSETPIRSGTARRGWMNKYSGNIGKSSKYPLAVNRVPYIGVLDEGSSRQAPDGIIEPAFNKTRKPQ